MDQSATARRTIDAIVRLCHAGLDSRELRLEVVRRLRTAVPIDAVFFATVDPETLLFTGSFVEEIPEQATPAFLANEFLQDDVNKFVALARAARPVQSLYAATRGEPDGSARYREILAPLGFGDELRAALRMGSVTWGTLCLHREMKGPGFNAAETALLETIAPHLAFGLRAAVTEPMPRARVQAPSGPWLVLHAARLSGPSGRGPIAVLMEPASAAEITPLVLQAYGLTVQEHLKSIFAKTGVHSRRELVAQLFVQQYMPRMLGAAASADSPAN